MLIVLAAIFIIVCVYSASLAFVRRRLDPPSPMAGKFNPRIAQDVLNITNDEDSDLLTEQSSASNLSGDDDDAEKSEELQYTEMQIEEPPSFFNSQYLNPGLAFKKNSKQSKPSENEEEKEEEDNENAEEKQVEEKKDEDEEDGIFQLKETKKRESVINANVYDASSDRSESSSSSSSSRRGRQPRKPRKSRKRKNLPESSSATLERWSILNWREKRDETTRKKMTRIDAAKAILGDGFSGGCYSAGPATPANAPDECHKKIFKHITIALEGKEVPTPKEVHHEELYIAGVNVKFPVKPYPSQIAVMNKLIQGCKKSEHCLLESPTGSGKTLALLCGVLAWQEKENEEFRQQVEEVFENANAALYETESESDNKGAEECAPSTAKAQNAKPEPSCAQNWNNVIDISDDNEFQPCKKICHSQSPNSACQVEKTSTEIVIDVSPDAVFEIQKVKRKVPKIYYGSRTHKQIEQVVRELKKTAYAYKKMTILSSREFTCIQGGDQNKTELCTKLLDPTKGQGCRYFNEKTRTRISTNWALHGLGINGPWDIEDLVKVGKQEAACPYFAARDLMMEAEIIFCPYNYLVDRNIRESMQINLQGDIVILDEAHNIEEMSRDVGSLYFRVDKILEVIAESKLLCIRRKEDNATYKIIQTYLENLVEFIHVNNLNTVDKFSETCSSDFWTGVQLCELFNIHSLGKGTAKTFEKAASEAIMDFNKAKEEMSRNQDIEPFPVITPLTKRFLEDFTLALQVMASEKLANDYRACIVEAYVKDFSQGYSEKRLRTLQMLCMNPAVIFAPLANAARSVVLASGTLSPTSSFQSELGTAFPHKLDANHVVPKENVYIRGIGCGPTGVQLKANYANVNSLSFQDELGRLVLDVCKVVPHGILCFFSSYSMMQKQIDRWKLNSTWARLEGMKHVLQEPRGSSNLEPVMQKYREIIKSTSEGPQDGITGALLLAVFRGKVAEGIDFSDNEARCVMAVGIPYAVRKDPSVDTKFTYNDMNQLKGLLKGGEWYAVQAFRALNQALGRCVRHRNDWGAVLLIDQRFTEKSSYNYLPKWVKTMWRDSARYNLTWELEQFVARHVERTKNEKSDSVDQKVLAP
ncbi:Fanconi anemia group J protein-like [Neodiprion fabricii]|uniref:Fanconi anemia group J protein-like n=1 Tax=Neodiprion fabricii TaxID=2872261 RepID=UPI001ED929BB|nr:Fanconi anemia group J protein-like [Neodiprion fabricii]